MLEKIAKLLAKAEDAATQEEAEAYFAKAQELATVHQISLAEAAAHHPDAKKKSPVTHRHIVVGEKGKQVNSHLAMLFHYLALTNDVMINVARDSTFVIAFGHGDDIDTVELMWSRIAPAMIRLGETYLATDVWRQEREYRAKKVKRQYIDHNGRVRSYTDEEWDYWPISKQNARASYYQGFRSALYDRLRQKRADVVAASQKAHDEAGDGVSTDLVLVDKAQVVKDYVREHSTAKGSYKGGRSGSSRRSSQAGYSDGQKVNLSGGAIGGSRKAVSA